MSVETIRHLPIFNVDKFNPKQVEVIGCGAIGSRLVMGLAKLGVEKIRVWDFDDVEEHNVANQFFGNQHVGKNKAETIAGLVKEYCGLNIEANNEKVDGSQKLSGVVFMCPDTMKSRKEIWLKSIKLKPSVDHLFECRMGTDSCRLYSISPIAMNKIKGYEESFYDDEETEESACGSKISVGPTAEFTSALLQWAFIRWHQSKLDSKKNEGPKDEVIAEVSPVAALNVDFE